MMYPEEDSQQDLPIEQDRPAEATVEATESTSEPVEQDQAAGGDTPDQKPQTRFDKRIGQLTGENYALKSDRDYWRNRALTETSEVAKPAVAAVESPKRPKLEDFDHDIDRFTDALGEYTEQSIQFQANAKAVEITEQGQQARVNEAKQTALQQRVRKFSERQRDFAEQHDDYFDIAYRGNLNITQDMTDAITEMENGPAVAYYLGKHPEAIVRIAEKETPAAVGAALANIEKQAVAELPKPVRTNESDAPEPPSTINTGRASATGKDPRNPDHTARMSNDEWMRQRTKQVRKQLNG